MSLVAKFSERRGQQPSVNSQIRELETKISCTQKANEENCTPELQELESELDLLYIQRDNLHAAAS